MGISPVHKLHMNDAHAEFGEGVKDSKARQSVLQHLRLSSQPAICEKALNFYLAMAGQSLSLSAQEVDAILDVAALGVSRLRTKAKMILRHIPAHAPLTPGQKTRLAHLSGISVIEYAGRSAKQLGEMVVGLVTPRHLFKSKT
jgi:hypothetical protein